MRSREKTKYVSIASLGILSFLLPRPIAAQPVPNQSACQYISTGAVLTAAQWNYCFQIKQDNLNFTPLGLTGGILTGELITAPSTTANAGFNIQPGVAPTTPSNGDFWVTAAGLFVQINGSTINFATPVSSVTAGNGTLTISPTTGAVVASCTNATSGQIGCSRPDNTTITVSGGILTAIGGAATSVTVNTTTVGGTGAVSGDALTNVSGVLQNSTFVPSLNGLSGTALSVTAGVGISVTPSSPNIAVALTAARQTKPTTQVFSTGNGTYTTPANVLWIEGWLIGDGGGGGGGQTGTATPGTSGNGTGTCWNTSGAACTTPVYEAGGGSGVVFNPSSGGVGGVISGSSSCVWGVAGGFGAAADGSILGGAGGNSTRGGSGASSFTSGSQPGVANTGGGGAGGRGSSQNNAGGGAGATCYFIITSPAGSYTYAVGGGGAGSSGVGGGTNGANGGSGQVVIIEHYGS